MRSSVPVKTWNGGSCLRAWGADGAAGAARGAHARDVDEVRVGLDHAFLAPSAYRPSRTCRWTVTVRQSPARSPSWTPKHVPTPEPGSPGQ